MIKYTMLAIVLLVTNASAQSYYTGSTLLRMCTAEPGDADYQMDIPFCVGYVVAIRDASQCGISVNSMSSSTPKGAAVGQLMMVVVKWLKDNPDKLHFSAESLVAAALQDAFPCPQK